MRAPTFTREISFGQIVQVIAIICSVGGAVLADRVSQADRLAQLDRFIAVHEVRLSLVEQARVVETSAMTLFRDDMRRTLTTISERIATIDGRLLGKKL
jgi:hypothetical protein